MVDTHVRRRDHMAKQEAREKGAATLLLYNNLLKNQGPKAGDMAQAVEHLHSKCKPQYHQKRKRRRSRVP
jgi:hypothetical protein